ncbi:hypothetical protein AB0I69_48690 [Streptomyces sp. NPDC050508]|uniref:hypothetical protein n=1 Tax=Streptomyces sp. NPDC050508 TaxID=3155405 RepID=UPI003424B0E0
MAESTVTYTYDANDLPQHITDSQAGNQAFTYDAYDRLISTTGPTGPTGTVNYGYDAGDRRTTMTAAGTSTTYGYDTSDILTSVTSGTEQVTFGLDAAGREKTASLPGGITRTTGYDTTGVITSIAYAQDTKTIMDPVTKGKYQYPNGYVIYMNADGQSMNPITGKVGISNADPYNHIPIP